MINLSDLPYETILNILDYLDTCDKIAFFTVFPEFSNKNGQQFSQVINLGRQFRSHYLPNICKDLSETINLSYIKIFNINSLYWIPEVDLLKCISEMKNVHTLLALDTKLELVESHCEIYKQLSLKKVALTLDLGKDQKSVFTALPNVEELCLRYGMKYSNSVAASATVAKRRFLYTSIKKCQDLEELVLIEEDEDCCYNNNVMFYSRPDLLDFLRASLKCRRFILKTRHTYIDLILNQDFFDGIKNQGFRIYYNNVRQISTDIDGLTCRDMHSCLLNLYCTRCTNTYEEMIFYKSEENNFDQLNLDARSLSNLEDIFKVFPIKDNDNGGLIVRCLQQAPSFNGNIEISDILKTLPNLYKLEVASCFLIHLDRIDGIESYFKNLQEFQVICCRCERYEANTVPKLEVISKFGNLIRKLSIENYICEDSTRNSASILANILKNCQNLESLQIILLHKSEDTTKDTNMVLVNNLKHARKLKEFGFYVKLNIIINPLIETLNNMEAKLERVYFKAHEVTGVQDKDDITRKIQHYIINNHHQLFLFVIDLTNNQHDIKSFENKKYFSRSFSKQCCVPNYIRNAHADLVDYRFNTGFNPFVNF